MIENLMPPKNDENSIIIVCGPPQLKKEVETLLKEMEYKNYFIFN